MKLAQALPDLVLAMENALAHLGRGDLAEQLRELTLERWTYDDFSDTAYLYLAWPANVKLPRRRLLDSPQGDRLSLYDEAGVNLDIDAQGRLAAIEVLDGKRIASRLANQD
jgi:uncharacterized protein YuzE